MKIKKITATEIPPIKNFMADDLKDLVVIAGPNGVGKTRLVDGILNYFRQGGKSGRKGHMDNPCFIIEATDKSERAAWGTSELDTSNPEQAVALSNLLRQNRRRRNFRNSIL